MHFLDELFHLSNGIAHQHALKVITVPQAVRNSGGYGVDIFKHCGVFCTYGVIAYRGIDIPTFKVICDYLCVLLVCTSDGKVG